MKLIALSQGKFAQVDDDDFEYLNQWKWSAKKGKKNNYYAVRSVWVGDLKKNKAILMHRLILNESNSLIEIDHINHNGLDNQKYNLRKANDKQNAQNRTAHGTSQYLGVRFRKKSESQTGAWIAQINIGGKCKHLGQYGDEKTAAIKYNEAAKEAYGEFANLNVIK